MRHNFFEYFTSRLTLIQYHVYYELRAVSPDPDVARRPEVEAVCVDSKAYLTYGQACCTLMSRRLDMGLGNINQYELERSIETHIHTLRNRPGGGPAMQSGFSLRRLVARLLLAAAGFMLALSWRLEVKGLEEQATRPAR